MKFTEISMILTENNNRYRDIESFMFYLDTCT